MALPDVNTKAGKIVASQEVGGYTALAGGPRRSLPLFLPLVPLKAFEEPCWPELWMALGRLLPVIGIW